ncbi:hypothetical protein IFR09_23025 [Pseudomonas syringae]|nr:hypothetical protein [Pseudomonas syringae]MBD8803219.1 hypothetical protein [Pseudomonas syringae]MBD8814039.1 hypothetical protein [Pseudomonas syringae]
MTIEKQIFITKARSAIQDLLLAKNTSNGEKTHAHISGYCRALLDCGVIGEREWELLQIQADRALEKCRSDFQSPHSLPGWPRAASQRFD